MRHLFQFTIAFALIGFVGTSLRAQDNSTEPESQFSAQLPADGITVPMKFRGDMPAAEVMVNGRGPYLFALDTGAQGYARADTTLVDSLKLPVVDSEMSGDASGRNQVELPVVKMEKLQLGDATYLNVEALSRDYNSTPYPRIDGMLGIGLFADHLLTLDFERQEIRITPGELPEPDGKNIFEMEPNLPIPAIKIPVGENELTFFLDSGNMVGAFTLPESAVSEMKFVAPLVQIGTARTVSNTVVVKRGQLAESIQLGEFEFAQPHIDTIDLPIPCNLGIHFLKHFVVTIDQRQGRIQFTRSSDEPIKLERRTRIGMGLGVVDKGLLIASVAQDSPAERAGVKSGDLIVEINGLSTTEIERDQLHMIMTSGNPLRLLVERTDQATGDTESLELRVIPEDAGDQ